MTKANALTAGLNSKGALLQALLAGEGYGLELIERVKQRTEGGVILNQGTVYPALRALEKEGLVESYESEPVPERGGRPRIFYQLTAEGRRAALDQRKVTLRLLGPEPALSY